MNKQVQSDTYILIINILSIIFPYIYMETFPKNRKIQKEMRNEWN